MGELSRIKIDTAIDRIALIVIALDSLCIVLQAGRPFHYDSYDSLAHSSLVAAAAVM